MAFPHREESATDFAEEPHFPIDLPFNNQLKQGKKLKILSLFSGCGGMDLGFEGGFIAHSKSINKKLFPNYIAQELENGFVRLVPTIFQTVFANDILQEARKVWIHNFSKLGYSPEIFHSESIVDLVKMHKLNGNIFPHVDSTTKCNFFIQRREKNFNWCFKVEFFSRSFIDSILYLRDFHLTIIIKI